MKPTAEQDRGARWMVLGVGTFAAAIAIYVGAGMIASARDAAQPPREATRPLVEVVSVRSVPQHHTVIEEGFLRPRAQIDVVPEVAGKIVEVAPQMEPGGRFDAGELLFRIDPRTFEADLTRARADVGAARAELERARAEDARLERLQEIGAAATARREQAKANLATARARLGQAEAALITAEKRLEDTEVRAPFAAAVISETTALGRFVQPGQSVATIFDITAGEVVVGLMPEDARAVRRAADEATGALVATITPSRASASAGALTGAVKRFGQSVDARSRTVPVVIEVPGAFDAANAEATFANDFVRVELPAFSPEPLYAAPNGVIREQRFVWTLTEDSRLAAVAVKEVQRTAQETLFSAEEDLTGRRIVLTALTEEAEGLLVDVVAETQVRAETFR